MFIYLICANDLCVNRFLASTHCRSQMYVYIWNQLSQNICVLCIWLLINVRLNTVGNKYYYFFFFYNRRRPLSTGLCLICVCLITIITCMYYLPKEKFNRFITYKRIYYYYKQFNRRTYQINIPSSPTIIRGFFLEKKLLYFGYFQYVKHSIHAKKIIIIIFKLLFPFFFHHFLNNF